ncbi:MAG TPA: inositol monophosphatase [Myxococcaceae bacterium]|nr:inositol monophosphatase [Myxococcaceae bacterium]
MPSPRELPFDLTTAVLAAREAVKAAEEVSTRHWRADGRAPYVLKEDGTELGPDVAAEEAMVQAIRTRFPDHAVLGEETGSSGECETRWVIDPIDGTAGYLRGGAHWGPVLALQHRGAVVAGAISLPRLGYRAWASLGGGTFRQDIPGGAEERVTVANQSDWQQATLILGELNQMARSPWDREVWPAVSRLAATARKARAHGDVAAFGEMLFGAHAWIEVGVRWWDVAPFALMLREAGGRVTLFERDGETEDRWSAVGSNAALHPHLLATLGLPSAP